MFNHGQSWLNMGNDGLSTRGGSLTVHWGSWAIHKCFNMFQQFPGSFNSKFGIMGSPKGF